MEGRIVGQKYILREQIGNGLSCVVYLGEHRKLHYTCAIKCISKTNGNGSAFLKETEFLKNLRSVYIPVLYDYEEDEEFCYLIEEYITGCSLKDLKQNQGFISQDRLIELSIKICGAVKWLHDRKPYPLLHLDLKPEHIMLAETGVKLLDFGSAAYLRGRSVSGMVMGTVGFASPEQLQGGRIDMQSDIYSIGAVLYWLMTGETLGNEGALGKVSGYSEEWNAIIGRCIELDRSLRYRSAEELIEAVCSLQQKNTQRQLEKSLKIAVVGSQRRVGVTHFSIGLCISGRQAGLPCLYEEKNDSGAIQDIYRCTKKVRERDGIYSFTAFEAIPRYGSAVHTKTQDDYLFVMDYGMFQEELMREYEEADCIVVVAGGKEWELKQTRDLIARYRKRKNMYYVLRTCSAADFRRIARELLIPAAFQMPAYDSLYSPGSAEQNLYKALLARMMEDKAVGSGEKKQKNWKLYGQYRRSRS